QGEEEHAPSPPEGRDQLLKIEPICGLVMWIGVDVDNRLFGFDGSTVPLQRLHQQSPRPMWRPRAGPAWEAPALALENQGQADALVVEVTSPAHARRVQRLEFVAHADAHRAVHEVIRAQTRAVATIPPVDAPIVLIGAVYLTRND